MTELQQIQATIYDDTVCNIPLLIMSGHLANMIQEIITCHFTRMYVEKFEGCKNNLSFQEEPGVSTSVVPALNEKILAHNSELTSFISILSDEKHELRRTMTKLEEEIWNYRQKESAYVQVKMMNMCLFENVSLI